ncbi:MAG: hypothetical protein MJZ02_10300 [Paludibacteraceae bacterium]|nr:hypothetical protein [Paludibacteraceae bacterium]
MKYYKLHINDNGHRIGFTFTDYDALKLRLERVLDKAKCLCKEMKEMKSSTKENEYLMEVIF